MFLCGIIFLFTPYLVTSFKYDSSCECGYTDTLLETRIVGGSLTKAHELPWTVGIYFDGEMHCGGALINNRYVLTAGHCVRWSDPDKLTIIIGTHRRQPLDGREIDISHTILHRGFYSYELYDDNDIALIRLLKPVRFNKNIQPVCLPKPGSNYFGQMGIVAGWGKVSVDGAASNYLKKTHVNIMTPAECKKTKIGPYTNDNVLCGYENKTDACQGDSGGPLVYTRATGQVEQIGVVSWGIGCASPAIPGVYTKVTKYLNWIDANTRDSIYCKNY